MRPGRVHSVNGVADGSGGNHNTFSHKTLFYL